MSHPVETAFEANTDLLNVMMHEAQVPKRRRLGYREYLREAKVRDRWDQFQELADRFSPLLKGQLMLHISRGCMERVYYFQRAPSSFLMEIASCLQNQFYTRCESMME